MVNKVVIDTSALIEYVYATSKGVVVKDVLENSENYVVIPTVVLAELVSKLKRLGHNPASIISFLESFASFTGLDIQTAISAGERHAELRKLDNKVGFIDCVIMQIAHEHDALILTSDSGFKHYKKTKFL
ncbi:MAG: PIN domain-containing protein [Candidatus Micrarchaeota archaeon]